MKFKYMHYWFYVHLSQNIAVTYLGMFIGCDYVFEPYNFIGINIRWDSFLRPGRDLFVIPELYCLLPSVAASLLYSYFKYKEQQEQTQKNTTSQSNA